MKRLVPRYQNSTTKGGILYLDPSTLLIGPAPEPTLGEIYLNDLRNKTLEWMKYWRGTTEDDQPDYFSIYDHNVSEDTDQVKLNAIEYLRNNNIPYYEIKSTDVPLTPGRTDIQPTDVGRLILFNRQGHPKGVTTYKDAIHTVLNSDPGIYLALAKPEDNWLWNMYNDARSVGRELWNGATDIYNSAKEGARWGLNTLGKGYTYLKDNWWDVPTWNFAMDEYGHNIMQADGSLGRTYSSPHQDFNNASMAMLPAGFVANPVGTTEAIVGGVAGSKVGSWAGGLASDYLGLDANGRELLTDVGDIYGMTRGAKFGMDYLDFYPTNNRLYSGLPFKIKVKHPVTREEVVLTPELLKENPDYFYNTLAHPVGERRAALTRLQNEGGYIISKDGYLVDVTNGGHSKVGDVRKLVGLSDKFEPKVVSWTPADLAAARKTFTSKSGIKFNSENWFSQGGRTRINNALLYTPDDVEIFNQHITDEYLSLADQLVNQGKLRKVGTGWEGEFNGEYKTVDPVQYTVAHSKAFEDAGLYWDGTNFRSGVPLEKVEKIRANGGLGHEQWLNDLGTVTLYYANDATNGLHLGTSVSMVFPKDIEIAPPLYRGTNPSSNHWYGGQNVKQHVWKTDPETKLERITEFKNYKDDASGGFGTSRVVPEPVPVKAFVGNNGNFDMKSPDIFSYNPEDNNNLEYSDYYG